MFSLLIFPWTGNLSWAQVISSDLLQSPSCDYTHLMAPLGLVGPSDLTLMSYKLILTVGWAFSHKVLSRRLTRAFSCTIYILGRQEWKLQGLLKCILGSHLLSLLWNYIGQSMSQGQSILIGRRRLTSDCGKREVIIRMAVCTRVLRPSLQTVCHS